MPYKNLVDCHNHSEYSPDSESKQIDNIKKAIEVGLSVITITDHCECNGYEGEYSYKIHTKNSIDALNELKKENFPITICTGIELGQPLQDLAAANEILDNDIDFVLGSLHNLQGIEDFYFMDYANMTISEMEKYIAMYFDEMLKMCKWGNFDSLSHINYAFRYMTAFPHLKIDITKFSDIVTDIFMEIIKADKAIEINTSRIHEEDITPMPIAYYVDMYAKLGGKRVTVGSDAHEENRIGNGIKEAYDIMSSCGINEVTYFVNRKPITLPIK